MQINARRGGGDASLAVLFLSSFSKEIFKQKAFSGLFIIQCHMGVLSVATEYSIQHW